MQKHLKAILVFLIIMLLIICGVSAASAKGFTVQLMEEGTEYTQFFGGFPGIFSPLPSHIIRLMIV